MSGVAFTRRDAFAKGDTHPTYRPTRRAFGLFLTAALHLLQIPSTRIMGRCAIVARGDKGVSLCASPSQCGRIPTMALRNQFEVVRLIVGSFASLGHCSAVPTQDEA